MFSEALERPARVTEAQRVSFRDFASVYAAVCGWPGVNDAQ
jgi:hypothetical protein